MIEKLADLADKYDKLTMEVSDPAILADQNRWQKLVKSRVELEDVVVTYREYLAVEAEIAGAEQILNEKADPELMEMARLDMTENQGKLQQLADELKRLLLPTDPNDQKNVILEIRAGTGGEEAALFANDLYKMYTRYAEKRHWRMEIMDANFTDIGGLKEIILLIEGKGAYSRLKFESGVHRVQRVPSTESSGRVHTSAATVAVLPEAEEVEVDISANDIRIDLFCATGPGGQCVNTTQSAVRITHIPTGIVVSCQDEKSQIKNKAKGMRVLRARVLEKMQEQAASVEASARKNQVGSGDRSERIRTYNYPERRVTDHRVGLTLHKLEWILEGELDEIIDALVTSDQAQRLRAD
ncbi:MAG: peptide chain release factor 1 [Clostridiales bacterium]